MEKEAKRIARQFDRGELPPEFDFTKPIKAEIVDLEKLKYNAFYKSYEFYERKFPPNFIESFGLQPMIKEIVELKQEIEPLEEIEKLTKELKLDDNNISD